MSAVDFSPQDRSDIFTELEKKFYKNSQCHDTLAAFASRPGPPPNLQLNEITASGMLVKSITPEAENITLY